MASQARTAGSQPGTAGDPGAEVATVVFLLTGTGVLTSEDGTAMWRSVPVPPSGTSGPTPAQYRRAKRAHPAFQGRLPRADGAFESSARPQPTSGAGGGAAKTPAGSTSVPVESATVEIYDPLTASWSAVPPGVRQTKVGEAFCSVLPDGRFLIGAPAAGPVATYDPTTRQWSTAGPPAPGRRSAKASSFIAVRLRG